MLLRREHIVSWRINWGPKSENIRALADELQLGLDSFIFVDDDPVVCAEVRAHCPEVLDAPASARRRADSALPGERLGVRSPHGDARGREAHAALQGERRARAAPPSVGRLSVVHRRARSRNRRCRPRRRAGRARRAAHAAHEPVQLHDDPPHRDRAAAILRGGGRRVFSPSTCATASVTTGSSAPRSIARTAPRSRSTRSS